MSQQIESLWPDDIKIEVLSPTAILRAQASRLSDLTKGILEGAVESLIDGDTVVLHLDLIAPALGDYQHRLLTATHNRTLIYPVRIESAYPRPIKYQIMPLPDPLDRNEEDIGASDDEEFMKRIKRILTSQEVRAIMASLIARTNEIGNGENDDAARES